MRAEKPFLSQNVWQRMTNDINLTSGKNEVAFVPLSSDRHSRFPTPKRRLRNVQRLYDAREDARVTPERRPRNRSTMGEKRSNRRIGRKKSLTHSPARSAALRSAALRSAPLRSAPLRATVSFVSEKVSMY